jgi:hypothetical protein
MYVHELGVIDTLSRPEERCKAVVSVNSRYDLGIGALGLLVRNDLVDPGADSGKALFESGDLLLPVEVLGPGFEAFLKSAGKVVSLTKWRFAGRNNSFTASSSMDSLISALAGTAHSLARIVLGVSVLGSFSPLWLATVDFWQGWVVVPKALLHGHLCDDLLLLDQHATVLLVLADQTAWG